MARRNHISVRVTNEEKALLEIIAERERCGLSEALRKVLDDAGRKIDRLEGVAD